jgi:hypothetical protein
MSRYRFLILVVILCLVPVSGYAKVYRYIDKEGVERYSNQPPPEGATIINTEKEIEYNEAADRTQQERNRDKAAPSTPSVSTSPPIPAKKGADVSVETGEDSGAEEKEYSRRKHRRKKQIRKEKAEMRKVVEAAEQTK